MSSIRSNASQSSLAITARRHRWVPILATVAALGLAAVTTDAAVIVGDPIDGERRRSDNAYQNGAGETLLAGRSSISGNAGHRAAFFVFDLTSVSGTIEEATLSLFLESKGSAGFSYNADLYAVGYSTTAGEWPSAAQLYYDGALDETAGVTLLANDFATPSSTAGSYLSLDGSGLVDYLNNRTAGYVVFRLNKDDTGGSQDTGYRFSAADSTLTEQLPKLTITAVPEPAAIGMLGLAFGGLTMLRRRRGQSV